MAGFAPFGDPPWLNTAAQFQNDFGLWSPPGSRVFYLCNGTRTGDDPEFTRRLVGGSTGTLSQALSYCRAGMNDTIFVLNGHAESVTDNTMLTNLVAGVRIIGQGSPFRADAPKFTWTNTAGSWVLDDANVTIRGLRLLCDGANGITKAINVTGAANALSGCYISWAAGAALKSTIGLEVGSAATDFHFEDNYVIGTATHNVTDGIKVVGATVPSGLYIARNKMIASATAANGLIHITVAALNCYIGYNTVYNTHTASTACIAVDNVAADGVMEYNNVATINDGTANAQGITNGAGSLFRFFQNFSSDEPKKSGVLVPAAVAT
jgi:hypothetical protein